MHQEELREVIAILAAVQVSLQRLEQFLRGKLSDDLCLGQLGQLRLVGDRGDGQGRRRASD